MASEAKYEVVMDRTTRRSMLPNEKRDRQVNLGGGVRRREEGRRRRKEE